MMNTIEENRIKTDGNYVEENPERKLHTQMTKLQLEKEIAVIRKNRTVEVTPSFPPVKIFKYNSLPTSYHRSKQKKNTHSISFKNFGF
jgi:hypothetical protein